MLVYQRLLIFALLPHLQLGLTSVLLIDQHIPVPGLSSFHIYYSLVCILHRDVDVPSLDTLLREELQHLLNLMRRSDGAPPDLNTLHNQCKCIERGNRILRRTNLDELPVDPQHSEILVQWHFGAGNRADDQIEGVPVVFRPVFVLVRGDEMGRTHLHSIFFLPAASADSDNFVAAECFGGHDSEVTKTADAHNADPLTGARAVLLQWTESRDTATQHRRRDVGCDRVRNLHNEV